jgi:hypothetical protein
LAKGPEGRIAVAVLEHEVSCIVVGIINALEHHTSADLRLG